MTKPKMEIGSWVSFEIPGARIFGTIERFNRKTATIFRKFASGYSRRKSFEKLRMWDVSLEKLTLISPVELKTIELLLEVAPRPYHKKDKKK